MTRVGCSLHQAIPGGTWAPPHRHAALKSRIACSAAGLGEPNDLREFSARSPWQIERRWKDLLDKQLVGEGSGARYPVVGGGYDGDQLLARKDVDLVTAGAVHGEALEVAVAGVEGLKPPEVAIIGALARVGVGADGPRNPIRG